MTPEGDGGAISTAGNITNQLKDPTTAIGALKTLLPDDSPVNDFLDVHGDLKTALDTAAAFGVYLPAEAASQLANAGIGLYGEPGTWYGAGPAQGVSGGSALLGGAMAGLMTGFNEYMQTGDIAGSLAAGTAVGGIVSGATLAFGPIGGLIAYGITNTLGGDADPYAGLGYQDAPKFNFEYNPTTGQWDTASHQYPNEFIRAYTQGLNTSMEFGKQALNTLGLDLPDEKFNIDSVGTRVTLFGTDRGDSSAGNNPYLFTSQEKETNQFADNIYTPPSKEQLFSIVNRVPYEMVYAAAKDDPNYKKAIAAYEMSLTGSPTRGYGTQSSPSDQYDTSIQAGQASLLAAQSEEGRDLKGLVDFLKNWEGDTTAWDSLTQGMEDRYSAGIDVIQGEYTPTAGNPDWSQDREMYQMQQQYKVPEGYTSDMMIDYYRRQAAMEIGRYDELFNREGRYIGPSDWLL